jgi:hypothetical protein
MRTSNKYVLILFAIAALIVVPGGVARIFGASDNLLCGIAALQLFAVMAFLMISVLSSLALSFSAVFEKEWWRAAAFLGLAAIPIGTIYLVSVTNPRGFEAVMSV